MRARYFPTNRSVGLFTAVATAVLAIRLSAQTISDTFQAPAVQEPSFPDRSVNISDFKAVPDGKTLNTEAFAKAIEAIANQGGGKVVVPPGLWLTGAIKLKSNVNLHL